MGLDLNNHCFHFYLRRQRFNAIGPKFLHTLTMDGNESAAIFMALDVKSRLDVDSLGDIV